MSHANRSSAQRGHSMVFDLLEKIGRFDSYPVLEEIDGHLQVLRGKPGFRIEPIGHSRLGREINLVLFGSGENPTILLWGLEDPHEPICSLSLMWLCAQLADGGSPIHRLGYDWAFIPCLNPDGVVRNEQWFRHPGDLRAFLNGSWEDELTFWGVPEHPEEKALEQAITRTRPELLFGMHDESHFPGHGYWALVSDEVMQKGLEEHFAYESRIGVEPVPPPVEPKTMRANWYFQRAHELNARCVSMICEPRGYRQLVPPREPEEDVRKQYEEALREYEAALGGLDASSKEEQALIRGATFCLGRMGQGRPFAVCVGACGLRVLKAHGQYRKAEFIEEAFWQYLSARLQGTYAAIPMRDQVRIQLHFLVSVMEQALNRQAS